MPAALQGNFSPPLWAACGYPTPPHPHGGRAESATRPLSHVTIRRQVVSRRTVQAFPWAALDRLDRPTERRLSRLRSWLEQAVDPARFAAAVSELLGTELSVVSRGAVARSASSAVGIRSSFALASGAGGCTLELEPALAHGLLAALLRRPAPLVSTEAIPDSALQGALSALVIEAARATGRVEALQPSAAELADDCVGVSVTVLLHGKPHRACVWLHEGLFAARPGAVPAAQLARLGGVALSLPLVVGLCLATPALLGELAVGAAFCPGTGLWVAANGAGRAVLVAPHSELGLAVELGSPRGIVLREPTTVPLAIDETMVTDGDSDASTARVVLDAPLVVRIELGSVSLSASSWAALRKGDVIETGQRIAEPVLLRVGGKVLARGELVSIDGELGVRVLELDNELDPARA